MSEAHATLSTQVGSTPVIALLTDEEAAMVLTMYSRAKERHSDRLDTAIDDAMQVLPRLIRIPARKIVFGK